ncbi:MAG: hypothetical protein K2P78_08785 [Gemmataceae bacterium]|nr:hypothetical protein [Gemmataceae bacterium]
MSTTVTLDEAQGMLRELIRQLAPGDEIVITDDHKPVARLVGEAPPPPKQPRPAPGWGRDLITYIAPDFDAPLEELKEYME